MTTASVLDLRRPSSAGSLPTRLRLPDLLRITDEGADDALHGRFDHLLPAGGLPVDERWATRIHADDELDVWLISWVPDKSTELHDHCGSLGALTVLSGSLHEYRWDGSQLVRRRLDAGDQAGFPLGWVHDVMRAPEIERCAGSCRKRAHAERARLLAAADRDVVLRSDPGQHIATQPHHPHRRARGAGGMTIHDLLASARGACVVCLPTRCRPRSAVVRSWSTSVLPRNVPKRAR